MVFFAVFLPFLIASAYSQQQTAVVVPASAVANGGVVVLPAATVLKANSVVPAAVQITCKTRDILAAGSKCIVNDCVKFRRIDCNNASSADLKATFQYYVDASKNASYEDDGPNMPLWVRLAGVSGNVNQDSFAPLAGLTTVRRLELVNTGIDNFTSNTFGNLRGLMNLDLNGVTNDVIPAGVFSSLGSLGILQIRNMPNLRVLENGSLDGIWDRNTSVCANIDIIGDSFVCDCDNNIWIQSLLMSKKSKVKVDAVPQVYSENATALVNCGVNIVCSQKSLTDFRGKALMDVNATVICANATSVKMNNAVLVTSTVSIKATTQGAAQLTSGLWMTSVLVFLCGFLARV